MTTRVYNEIIEISNSDTQNFWHKRAQNSDGLKAVLLGDDKNAHSKRNEKECRILMEQIKDLEELDILDIGCGIGRWAENLYGKIRNYTGIDYSKGFIEAAKERFREDENINFYEMSVCNMTPEICAQKYNLIICTGVLMYVNDSDLEQIFRKIRDFSPEYIHIQESISLMDGRLTLDNFESKELKSNYSAIYRTQAEYEQYFKDFDIIKTDLLLDDEIGGRKETNARYWIGRIK